jgi:predicted amidohydrolase
MASKTIRIAAAQMKFRRTIPENLEVIQNFIADAGRLGADALLFPECAITGYNNDFHAIREAEVAGTLDAVADSARRARCAVLIGSPTFRRGSRFNSLVVFNKQGRLTFRYDKIHLTPRDAECFTPGNAVALFDIARVPCTAIICHERRYPELVRLPVMLGAQILFHPNAGLDRLEVSKTKRGGRDGIAVRAFENQIFYVFANSVGRQGNGLWSAGDSKIVGPDSRVLALANNSDETLISADLDLTQAGRKYARDALEQPAFLRGHWKRMLAACRAQLRAIPE